MLLIFKLLDPFKIVYAKPSDPQLNRHFSSLLVEEFPLLWKLPTHTTHIVPLPEGQTKARVHGPGERTLGLEPGDQGLNPNSATHPSLGKPLSSSSHSWPHRAVQECKELSVECFAFPWHNVTGSPGQGEVGLGPHCGHTAPISWVPKLLGLRMCLRAAWTDQGPLLLSQFLL